MSPHQVSKMKQVCAASPGKFASALLDILDGSVEEPSYFPGPAPISPSSPVKSQCKVMPVRKRPAAATDYEEEMPAKKIKIGKGKAASVPTPKKAAVEDDHNIAAQRRKELKSMKLARIKSMSSCKGLGVSSKDKMIESIIQLEAKSRANIRKHKANARDVVGKKREELAGMTNNQLKDLLQAYALQTGGSKPERVERLLVTWQEQGEIEKVLAGLAFKARKVELNAMDKVALYDLCVKKGVDALSKEVIVERLLVHESVEIWQEVMQSVMKSRHKN